MLCGDAARGSNRRTRPGLQPEPHRSHTAHTTQPHASAPRWQTREPSDGAPSGAAPGAVPRAKGWRRSSKSFELPTSDMAAFLRGGETSPRAS